MLMMLSWFIVIHLQTAPHTSAGHPRAALAPAGKHSYCAPRRDSCVGTALAPVWMTMLEGPVGSRLGGMTLKPQATYKHHLLEAVVRLEAGLLLLVPEAVVLLDRTSVRKHPISQETFKQCAQRSLLDLSISLGCIIGPVWLSEEVSRINQVCGAFQQTTLEECHVAAIGCELLLQVIQRLQNSCDD